MNFLPSLLLCYLGCLSKVRTCQPDQSFWIRNNLNVAKYNLGEVKHKIMLASGPKMSISGQIVSEIVAQLCLENSIQTLLIFFFLGRLSFLLTSHRRDEAHHSSTTRLPLSNSKLDHIVSNLLFIPAWWNCRCTRKQSVTGGTKPAQAGILWVPIACTAPHSSGPLSSSRNSFWSSVLSRRHISLSSKLIADPTTLQFNYYPLCASQTKRRLVP